MHNPLKADGPVIEDGCVVIDSDFGAYTWINSGTRVQHSVFGDYSYCDRNCDVANAQIGKFANIASGVRIGATDHPLERASLHHFMYRSSDYWPDAEPDAAFFEHRRSRLAVVGHDTWIGHNAQIKPEVTVGHGAVVAAGAVVTKDVAPYTIVAGMPAKVLRLRQPEPIAERLMALAWWDWDHDRIGDALEDFRSLDADAFLEKYE
jgi:phosphonate metabolism protein (transferase hexapeptide repeat family)